MAQSYRIESATNELVNFNADKLFVSILEALAHRDSRFLDARALTDTATATIIHAKRLVLNREDIVELVSNILKKFDRTAYIRYVSMHT
jgi:transcriptional regulator NrdR family protein